jgi:LCP family protein required for cell wall assembly
MKNKKGIIIVISIAVLLVVVGIIAKYINDANDYKRSMIPAQNLSTETEKSEDDNKSSDYLKDINASSNIVTVLVLGVDDSESRDLGVYRSDIISVVRINLETNKIKVLNIPRDTYTYIPVEKKKDKITHAYAYGSIKNNGVQASIDAVNDFFGRDTIDYYFVTTLDPVAEIVDSLGGIEVDVDTRIVNPYGSDFTIEKGTQVLDGEKAVIYLRWRYSSGGDLDRIKHFQNFLSAVYKQIKENNQIMYLVKIVYQEKDNLQMNLNMKQLIGFAAFFKQLPENSINYYSLTGNSKTINDISYWIPGDNTDVLNEFLNDSTTISEKSVESQ